MNRLNINKIIFLLTLYTVSFLVLLSSFLYTPKTLDGWENLRIILFVLFIPLLTKYSLHILAVPWYSFVTNRILKKNYTNNYNPKVSFLIPAYNEEVGIIGTIESVLESFYKNFELIIINDGSSDKTSSLVKNFIKSYNGDVSIRYIEKENGGKSSALNLAIEVAEGEIVITSDADCSIDKNAISNLVKHFSDKKIMAVAGNVIVGNNRKIIGSIQKLEYVYGFYFKRADSILNSVYIVGGAAAAYRKSVFNELGEFDNNIITEDIEYSTRILNAGYKISYAADSIFYTEAPSDVRSLIKQRLRWKYGRLKTFYKYRHLFFKFSGKHSKFLSFVVLPVALFAELLLFLEVVLLPAFYIYSFLSADFIPLIFVMLVLSIIIILQVLTCKQRKELGDVIIFAPVAWIIFYFVDFIEYVALIKGLIKISKKNKVTWQKWERRGVFN